MLGLEFDFSPYLWRNRCEDCRSYNKWLALRLPCVGVWWARERHVLTELHQILTYASNVICQALSEVRDVKVRNSRLQMRMLFTRLRR